MADVKVQTPAKDNRTGGGAQGGQKTPMNIKENNNNNNTPAGNKGNKGNNNPDAKSNSAGKKRKMNHNNNGPPHNQNQSQNGGERGDRSGGGGPNSGVWNPGPGGPQPFQTHRLTGAPAWDLPPQNAMSQTFTGRCRLFVANLPNNVTEDTLRKIFSDFGQLSEVYIGKGNQFAFIKMDTRQNAEAAKNNLDGRNVEGRTLRVRLAAHAAAIKVTNLPPAVSNELLHLAFSTFGPVERAVVIADDRGRSINEGIVEFVRKSSAQAAIKKCQTECLLLSGTPIPVVATSLDARDEEEGVPEKSVIHTLEYRQEREFGPRFAEPGTVEYEVAKKWKQLSVIEVQRREAFEQEMRDMHENFKNQMEYIKIEETTKQLREQLRQMEAQSLKINTDRETRYDVERQREEARRAHEAMLRQQEEQLVGQHANTGQTDLVTLRRQENELRQQANALQQILDRQENSLRGGVGGGGPMGGGGPPVGHPSGPPHDMQMNAYPGGQQQMGGGYGQPPMIGPMNPYGAPSGGPPPGMGHPGNGGGPPPLGHHQMQQGYGQPYGNSGPMGMPSNMPPHQGGGYGPGPGGPSPVMNHGGPPPGSYGGGGGGGLPKRNRRF